MDKRPIGIFDSGVGGLSVLAEVKKILPHESFIYFADQKNVPYGNKTPGEIRKITGHVMEFLMDRNIKMVIIACNTATVHALDSLREKYKLPILGIFPVVKTASERTRNGRIAILSTIATSKSEYQEDLIVKFADGRYVVNFGTDKLVPYVERGDTKSQRLTVQLTKLLKILKEEKIDTLALGCSHFPFLRKKITRILGRDVLILDSGAAVARQAKNILKLEKIESHAEPHDIFYTTGSPTKFKKISKILLGIDLEDVRSARL
ncbi:MAG TPA: glutamate racemase [Patescibacteria group bacterium]|nr:glutamate racemase [Patescibacteria group bacterium]